MKINPDCVRQLMFFLEERTKVEFQQISGHTHASYYELCPALFKEVKKLEKYELDEIFYHIVQLSESGYISTDYSFDPLRGEGYFRLSRVYYVTPKGHEFIAAIKDDNVWNNAVKPVFKSLGSVSLAIIESVASGATSAIIEHLKPKLF